MLNYNVSKSPPTKYKDSVSRCRRAAAWRPPKREKHYKHKCINKHNFEKETRNVHTTKKHQMKTPQRRDNN